MANNARPRQNVASAIPACTTDAARTLGPGSTAPVPTTTLESGVSTSTTLARLARARTELPASTKGLVSLASARPGTQVELFVGEKIAKVRARVTAVVNVA